MMGGYEANLANQLMSDVSLKVTIGWEVILCQNGVSGNLVSMRILIGFNLIRYERLLRMIL